MSRSPRRTFSPEFKLEAVNLVIEQKVPLRQVCRELDISESALGRWVRQARIDRGLSDSDALTSEEKTELAQLRKENRRLRMEHDILKKAAAFFAKESL